MDLSQPEHYAGLKQWIDERGADTAVLYLATSPHLFPVICEQLGAAGLNGPKCAWCWKSRWATTWPARRRSTAWCARRLPRAGLRIDHYLGKPAVQNLMALRFGNALFEPLWRRESIANIQITLAEAWAWAPAATTTTRTGALRDMIQNHALQLLTMIAMEPPATSDADAIRDEKLKVLRSLKPFTPESVARDVVRGQYKAGTRGRQAGARLPGRGEGARRQPLRDLRRAAHRGAELALGRRAVLPAHRQAPGRAATRRSSSTSARCRTHLPGHAARQQAGDQAAARGRAGTAPAGGQGRRVRRGPSCWRRSLDLDFDKAFASERVGAYERLLLDAIAGRLNLFVRSDEQEQAWRWVNRSCRPGPPTPTARAPTPPAAGGPAASALVARGRLHLGRRTVRQRDA
jgi:glucose-6-phosphate 1-dehydrogenase